VPSWKMNKDHYVNIMIEFAVGLCAPQRLELFLFIKNIKNINSDKQ
jgi:hypothetical protein